MHNNWQDAHVARQQAQMRMQRMPLVEHDTDSFLWIALFAGLTVLALGVFAWIA